VTRIKNVINLYYICGPDVPRSVVRVCCNPVYLCIILGACSHVTLVGFATFLTKYLQAHFGITAALASIYTGKPPTRAVRLPSAYSMKSMLEPNSY